MPQFTPTFDTLIHVLTDWHFTGRVFWCLFWFCFAAFLAPCWFEFLMLRMPKYMNICILTTILFWQFQYIVFKIRISQDFHRLAVCFFLRVSLQILRKCDEKHLDQLSLPQALAQWLEHWIFVWPITDRFPTGLGIYDFVAAFMWYLRIRLDIVLLFLRFLVIWDCSVQDLFWEQGSAQPGARRHEKCRICHYLSWTDSMKLSLLFSNFGGCISKGSLFRLFRDHNSCRCAVWGP